MGLLRSSNTLHFLHFLVIVNQHPFGTFGGFPIRQRPVTQFLIRHYFAIFQYLFSDPYRSDLYRHDRQLRRPGPFEPFMSRLSQLLLIFALITQLGILGRRSHAKQCLRDQSVQESFQRHFAFLAFSNHSISFIKIVNNAYAILDPVRQESTTNYATTCFAIAYVLPKSSCISCSCRARCAQLS